MPATAIKHEDARSRLSRLARDELEKADGNTVRAITAVIEVLMKDKALLRELVAPIVIDAARMSVSYALRNVRQGLFDPSHGKRNVLALARGISASLLDFPLQGGLRLRDATRAQVIRTADHYQKAGTDMVHKARWLTAIAQSVPDNKTVGDVVTDERAIELWKDAGHE